MWKSVCSKWNDAHLSLLCVEIRAQQQRTESRPDPIGYPAAAVTFCFERARALDLTRRTHGNP